jgi:hypothetical protein
MVTVTCTDGTKKDLPQGSTPEQIAAACPDASLDVTDPKSCPAEPLKDRLATLFPNGAKTSSLSKTATIALYERPVNAAGTGAWKLGTRTTGWFGDADLDTPASLFLSIGATNPNVKLHYMQSGLEYHTNDQGVLFQTGDEIKSSMPAQFGIENCDVTADGNVQCNGSTITTKDINGVRNDVSGATGWSGTVGKKCARLARTSNLDKSTQRMFVIYVTQK